MGLQKNFDRTFVVVGGTVQTSGGSLALAKGQFGVFDTKKTSKQGVQAVSTYAGVPSNDKRYELRLGTANRAVSRSQHNKAMSTFPFALNDVKGIRVNAPSSTEQKVDELLVGYNGIDDSTTLSISKGESQKLYIELSGEPIGLLGYEHNKFVFEVYMNADACPPSTGALVEDCVDCDPCETVNCLPVILDTIDQIKRQTLKGLVPVTDFIEVMPVQSCDSGASFVTTDSEFWTLEVADTGDQAAFAAVQAQYSGYPVVRTDRVGVTSTYQILVPAADVDPTDYSITPASIIKECEDCPSGYTLEEGGEIYMVMLEDEGADETATVETLAGAIATTAVKNGQDSGKGIYTVLTDDKLTDAEIATFLASATPLTATATIGYVGSSLDICDPDASSTVAWVVGDACQVATENYTIILPDNDCGSNADRLAELQLAYPDNSIIVAQRDTANSSQTVTLTGTSGTADVTIGAVAYTATFNTNLTTTADDFITTNAAAILAATGGVVTAALGVITYTDATTGFPTDIAIANATGDLAGTVGTAAVITEDAVGGCQTKYQATVITDLVCAECDPIFRDIYRSEAPEAYFDKPWTLSVDAYAALTGCKCGIRFKGLDLTVSASDALRDSVGYIDSSTKIRVSSSFPTEIREGIKITDEDVNVEYLSRWEPRNNMGGEFYFDEDNSTQYFTGEGRHYGSDEGAINRFFKGHETSLDPLKQYVDYQIDIDRSRSTQSMSGRLTEGFTYHILVPVGEHQNVEAVLNTLAGAAGLAGVKAFGA